MHDLAVGLGYREPVLLCGPEATADAFLDTLRARAAALAVGDLLLVSFAGHGRRLWGRGGPVRPHALFLADRLVTDTEIGELLDAIPVRARVVFLLDACCSGGFLGEWIAARGAGVEPLERSAHAGAPAARCSPAASALILASSPADRAAAAARARGAVPPFTDALLRCWPDCSSWLDLRDRMAVLLADAGAPAPQLASSDPALSGEPPFRIASGRSPARRVALCTPS